MTTSRKLPSDDMEKLVPKRRVLPKLLACITKTSLENMRNKALFSIDTLDAKGIRRRKLPLWECLILELKESGYTESSNYLQDLLYDNSQLVAEDDIGIVVNLRERDDYLEHICSRLQTAEREREREDTKKECLVLLNLALHYAEKGKGILWLAEKFFLASIAIASRYLIDGGRLKGVCKYFYSTFLLDKFPGADTEEPYLILTEVRDAAIGKEWPLYESTRENEEVSKESLFDATAKQLHRVLLHRSRLIRRCDAAKAERLARLAERRGQDANDLPRVAEAIIEEGICQLAMNNLNNAKKTFHRAFRVNTQINNVEGLCITRMHLAAVMQRLGDHEMAAQLLTEMGALAMEYRLRRELGLALHLLGELHLRRERPELGTQHLTEAFYCFMGCTYSDNDDTNPIGRLDSIQESAAMIQSVLQHSAMAQDSTLRVSRDTAVEESAILSKAAVGSSLGVIYSHSQKEVYKEEAERSRVMTAISAGQEVMASYFELLHQARICTVATVKCIEWKLFRNGWWVNRYHHDLVPCVCPLHNRTPLDVLWYEIEMRNFGASKSEYKSVFKVPGQRMDKSYEDIRKIQSTGEVEEVEGEKTEGEKEVKVEGDKNEDEKKEGDKKEDENKEDENKEEAGKGKA